MASVLLLAVGTITVPRRVVVPDTAVVPARVVSVAVDPARLLVNVPTTFDDTLAVAALPVMFIAAVPVRLDAEPLNDGAVSAPVNAPVPVTATLPNTNKSLSVVRLLVMTAVPLATKLVMAMARTASVSKLALNPVTLPLICAEVAMTLPVACKLPRFVMAMRPALMVAPPALVVNGPDKIGLVLKAREATGWRVAKQPVNTAIKTGMRNSFFITAQISASRCCPYR